MKVFAQLLVVRDVEVFRVFIVFEAFRVFRVSIRFIPQGAMHVVLLTHWEPISWSRSVWQWVGSRTLQLE